MVVSKSGISFSRSIFRGYLSFREGNWGGDSPPFWRKILMNILWMLSDIIDNAVPMNRPKAGGAKAAKVESRNPKPVYLRKKHIQMVSTLRFQKKKKTCSNPSSHPSNAFHSFHSPIISLLFSFLQAAIAAKKLSLVYHQLPANPNVNDGWITSTFPGGKTSNDEIFGPLPGTTVTYPQPKALLKMMIFLLPQVGYVCDRSLEGTSTGYLDFVHQPKKSQAVLLHRWLFLHCWAAKIAKTSAELNLERTGSAETWQMGRWSSRREDSVQVSVRAASLEASLSTRIEDIQIYIYIDRYIYNIYTCGYL